MKPERTIFQIVRVVGRKYVDIDGKRRRREKTFKQNIDLFNLNGEGKPKSYDEVLATVAAQAKEWENVH
jgi:hypothetical protein